MPTVLRNLHKFTRKLMWKAIAVFSAVEAYEIDQLIDTGVDACGIPVEKLWSDADVLGDGHVRKQADTLKHVTDPAVGRGDIQA